MQPRVAGELGVKSGHQHGPLTAYHRSLPAPRMPFHGRRWPALRLPGLPVRPRAPARTQHARAHPSPATSRSASNDSRWRPKALRRTEMSIDAEIMLVRAAVQDFRSPARSCPHRSRARACPRQAVHAGGLGGPSFRGAAILSSIRRPARREPQPALSSAGPLTSKASAPRLLKSSTCSRKSPWSATTPTRSWMAAAQSLGHDLGAPFPSILCRSILSRPYQPRSDRRVATAPDSSPLIASPSPLLTLATIS